MATRSQVRAASLLYHDVVAPGQYSDSGFSGSDADVYKLHVADFEDHLRALSEVLSGTQPTAIELLEQGADREACLLHFDDGGMSAHSIIATRLEDYGWRGHFYIVTDKIGEPGFMGGDEIRDLHRRGHIIGTHSRSHPIPISQLSYDEVALQWKESANVLSDLLGEHCRVASIPGGFMADYIVRAARAAGLDLVFNSEPEVRAQWREGCLVMGRYNIQQKTPANVAKALASGSKLPRLQQWGVWNTKKVLKRAFGKHWFAARKYLLSR